MNDLLPVPVPVPTPDVQQNPAGGTPAPQCLEFFSGARNA
jgi:hypothetical protein